MYASNYSSINRSFSSDVMAAMLVYKNNRFSLRWELISIVRKFCTNIWYCFVN